MKLRTLLVVCAALALTVGVATASAGGGPGDAANAKQCRKGGWQHLYRSDGSTFKKQDECVSYAKRGGTLLTSPPPPPYTKSKLDCESFGGTFSVGPAALVVWRCDNAPGSFNTLLNDCAIDGGDRA